MLESALLPSSARMWLKGFVERGRVRFEGRHAALESGVPHRTPRRWRDIPSAGGFRQVLECASLLALWRSGRTVWHLVGLILLISLPAQIGWGAETDKLEALFERWFEVQTNLQSWSADFTQTRSLKVLAQPLVSTGKVWVAQNSFRWELGEPAQTIALRQPDQLVIFYPRLKRAEKYALGAVPTGPVKDALALLDASMPRDRAAMEDRFRLLSATETNATLQVRLQPKSASARKLISEILIGFRTNDYSIAITEMTFADGSNLRNEFTNVVMNAPIAPERFEAKLGPDVTVVEPLRK